MTPAPQPRMIWLALVAMIAAFTVVPFLLFAGQQSPDLMATWLAGHFFGLGAFDQIYPADTTVYTMRPPPDWWPYLLEQGRGGPVFPYVYPPLWAALASHLTPYASIDGFQFAGRLVNPALLAATVVLALRIAGLGGIRLLFSTALGLLIMILTLPGAVALLQNQPQILVSFLILAALHADLRGAVLVAGITLALAAAIKIYPALIAILWLATGKYRACAVFAVTGAMLGLVSVALAGWPLHADFLRELRIIKESVMTTRLTYGIDATVANLWFADKMQFIAALDNLPDAPERGWRVLEKTALWSVLSMAAMVALLGAAALWLRTRGDTNPLFWPAFLIGLALISPLSWGYHFLPAMAFAPALLFIWGPRTGCALLLAICLPISVFAIDLLASGAVPYVSNQLAGTLAMTLLGLTLLVTPRPTAPSTENFDPDMEPVLTDPS